MIYRTCCLSLALVGLCLKPCDAADPKAKTSLSNLSLEVSALQTLHRFQMTPEQMESLRKLAAETSPKEAPRKPGKGSAKLRQVLSDLRIALNRGDGDRIAQLEEKLDEAQADEDDLDDAIEITLAARRRASEVLGSLTPRQVAIFLSDSSADVPEPLEELLVAIENAGKLKDAEWKEFAEDAIKDLSWQLGGLDLERSRFVGRRVEQFLSSLRSLKEKDLKRQRADFEKAARQFVSQVPPTMMLHHFTEHTLAELLSNPRLLAALDARLKK